MVVPHGNTIEEYIDCYKHLANLPNVYSIGLGGVYSNKKVFNTPDNYVSGREYIIDKLIETKILDIEKTHHLLGLGDSGNLELNNLKRYPFIRSCDSSAAYILAKNEILISTEGYIKIKEKINFTDDFDENRYETLIVNLKHLYTVAQ